MHAIAYKEGTGTDIVIRVRVRKGNNESHMTFLTDRDFRSFVLMCGVTSIAINERLQEHVPSCARLYADELKDSLALDMAERKGRKRSISVYYM